MPKIIRSVLQVAAVAVNFIPGIGQLASAAITIGLSVGAGLLTKHPKMPVNSPENANRLRASIDPRTPRKIVVGGPTAMRIDAR